MEREAGCEAQGWTGAEHDLQASGALEEAAARLIEHHRAVTWAQAAMYRRAAEPRPRPTLRERAQAIDALMADFDGLDARMAALDAWSRGEETPLTPLPGAGVGGGGAVGGSVVAGKAGFGGAGGSSGFDRDGPAAVRARARLLRPLPGRQRRPLCAAVGGLRPAP